jgi:hypothetical protein
MGIAAANLDFSFAGRHPHRLTIAALVCCERHWRGRDCRSAQEPWDQHDHLGLLSRMKEMITDLSNGTVASLGITDIVGNLLDHSMGICWDARDARFLQSWKVEKIITHIGNLVRCALVLKAETLQRLRFVVTTFDELIDAEFFGSLLRGSIGPTRDPAYFNAQATNPNNA